MPTILCVEDDPRAAELLAGLLESRAHRVYHARTVQEAWTRLKEVAAVDLLILDNELEGEHGYDLLTDLREHTLFSKMPVLIYTGVSDRRSVLTYIGLKIQNILVKPYRAECLEMEVNKAIHHNWIENVVRGGDHRSEGSFSADEYDSLLEETVSSIEDLTSEISREVPAEEDRVAPESLAEAMMASAQLGFPELEEVLAEIQIFCEGKQWQDARELVPQLQVLARLLDGHRIRRCELIS